MEQVNYRGYARSVGFDPIKAPTQAVERMAERDNRIIRNMERDRQATKQVRDDYLRGLERKNAIEAQDRDRNYAWESKLRENRQQAVQARAKTEIQSALQRGENAKQVFEGLAQFSSTVADTLTEYKKAKDEQDMLDGYLEVATGTLSPERMQMNENAETLLKASGAAQDTIAEGLQQRGADPYIVTNLLSGNKARDYGRLKAHMEMSMTEFPDFARDALDEMGASTAAERAQAMPQVFGEFLKQRGLFGLKADFMAKGLMEMRGSYNSLIAEARRSDIISKSEMMRDESMENLFRSKSGESLTEAFQTLSRSYGEDGRTPVGRAKAKQLLFQELGDTTRYSEEDVKRILGEAMTDQGTSWLDRFGRDVDDLIKKRRQDAQTEFNLNQAEEAQARKRAEDEVLGWVKENWNGDEETLKEIIKESKVKGISTDRLQAYLAYSNEQKNADFWNREFEEQYDQGLLMTEDVDQPGVPPTVRETWRQRAQQQEKARADAGISTETLKKVFNDALKFNLVGESTDRTPHYSLGLATEAALSRFNQKFKSYSRAMDAVAAATQARIEVEKEIAQGATGQGTFAVIPSNQGRSTQAFFAGFTSGNHAGAPSLQSSISLTGTLRDFRANPNIIEEKVLVSPALLKDIDNRIRAGKPISIPGLFSDLARVTQGDRSAVDILNSQLRAAGLTGQVQPGFRNQLSQINDPRLQSILNQPLTQDRLNTAIIGGGHAPATIRTGPSGFQDVVAVSSAAGYKFPMVAAAQWALESGYGQSHSGRNNVFGIKGSGRTVQTQEFVNGRMVTTNASFRDYNSPLESARDYVNLMNNSRYAPGLAAARTPREAIQAIAAAGYATDPGYVDKVVKIMTQNGVAVDMPYTQYQGPAHRNPSYMRPTLAYIAGNIGPTSTGAHLDVKQQDNPNTPANEFAQNFAPNALDNYVVVDDPELGRVPLGRTPITNTFAQHQARGSHGIDYGLYAGTKIHIQNGARVVSKTRTQHGDKLVIQLPDGRRFSFLHGNAV